MCKINLNKKKLLFAISSLTLLFILDRFLKYIALYKNYNNKFLKLTKNYYVFWGFSKDEKIFEIVKFASIFLLLALSLNYFIKKIKLNNKQNFGILLICIGGLSNTIDRIYYNYVIDYFYFYISNFNLADIYIIIGIFMVILNFLKKNLNSSNEKLSNKKN